MSVSGEVALDSGRVGVAGEEISDMEDLDGGSMTTSRTCRRTEVGRVWARSSEAEAVPAGRVVDTRPGTSE